MSEASPMKYGWTAVPRNGSNVPTESQAKTEQFKVDIADIWPRTDLVRKTHEYATLHIPIETLNHSLRVYCYGHAIVTQHLPTWTLEASDKFFETYALTCLLHDIATITSNRLSTRLSFEFQGGFIGLQELQAFGAPQAQAESVCEAIIRHQDPGETGMISQIGQLIQLATELDNMGWQPYLVHKNVIEQVVELHPRLKWSSCFARSLQDEMEEKPWCHTTAIPGFIEAVAGNKTMAPYD